MPLAVSRPQRCLTQTLAQLLSGHFEDLLPVADIPGKDSRVFDKGARRQGTAVITQLV